MISLIAAMGKNRVIGRGNDIPWHLPADFAYFKNVTLHHPVIMGRKTFESIGKPLPSRTNIVLSRQSDIADGVTVFSSLEEATAHGETLCEEVFIIGGARVYTDAINVADRLYITYVDGEFNGDTFFPEIEESDWLEIYRKTYSADKKNMYSMDFVVYERRK